jgi:hypothetical protein
MTVRPFWRTRPGAAGMQTTNQFSPYGSSNTDKGMVVSTAREN